MTFALVCFIIAGVASLLEWVIRDRSIPPKTTAKTPTKTGPAWEQDYPWPECFEEDL